MAWLSQVGGMVAGGAKQTVDRLGISILAGRINIYIDPVSEIMCFQVDFDRTKERKLQNGSCKQNVYSRPKYCSSRGKATTFQVAG